MNPSLSTASASDLSSLNELLDGLIMGKSVQPLQGLPAALARLRAAVDTDPSAAVAGADEAPQPGTRLESATLGMLAFGAANAFLMQEQAHATPLIGSSPGQAPGLAYRAGQGDASGMTAAQAGVQIPSSEADWAAAGARDHAMLAALDAAGLLPAQPGWIDFSALPVAGAESPTALDQLIRQLDADIENLGSGAALMGEPISPQEAAAAADALASQPLTELLTGAGHAAKTLQVGLEQAQAGLDASPASPAMQEPEITSVLPDLAAVLEVLAQAPALVEEVAGDVTGVLENVGVLVEGVPTPVAELTSGRVQDLASLVPELAADLGPAAAVAAAPVLPLPDAQSDMLHDAIEDAALPVVGHVQDAAGAVEEVANGVEQLLTPLTDAAEAIQETVENVLHALGETPAPAAAAADGVSDLVPVVGQLLDEVVAPLAEAPQHVVDSLADTATAAVDALEDVASVVADAAGAGQDVANAVEDAAAVVEGVAAAVEEPAAVVEEVATAVEEPTAAVDEVPGVVQDAGAVADVIGGSGDVVDAAGEGVAAVEGVLDPVGELVADLLSPPAGHSTTVAIVDAVSLPSSPEASQQPLQEAKDLFDGVHEMLPLPQAEASDGPGLQGDLPSVGAGGDGAAGLAQLLPGLKPDQ